MSGALTLRAPGLRLSPRVATLASLFLLQGARALLFVGGKIALADVPPLTLEGARRLGAAVILLGALVVREGLPSLRPTRADLLDAIVPGILGFGLARACVMIGLSLASPTNVALIDATAPAIALVLAAVVAVERPPRLAVLASIVALAGVAGFIVAGGSLSRPSGGEMVVLGSPIVWGSIYVWVARRKASSSLLRRTTWFTVAGAAALAAPGLVLAPPAALAALGGPTVLWVLVLGVAVGVVENWLTFRAVSIIGAVGTSEFEYLVPVLSAVAGVVALGSPILPVQMAAGVVILGALALSGRIRAREAELLPGRPCCVS